VNPAEWSLTPIASEDFAYSDCIGFPARPVNSGASVQDWTSEATTSTSPFAPPVSAGMSLAT